MHPVPTKIAVKQLCSLRLFPQTGFGNVVSAGIRSAQVFGQRGKLRRVFFGGWKGAMGQVFSLSQSGVAYGLGRLEKNPGQVKSKKLEKLLVHRCISLGLKYLAGFPKDLKTCILCCVGRAWGHGPSFSLVEPSLLQFLTNHHTLCQKHQFTQM